MKKLFLATFLMYLFVSCSSLEVSGEREMALRQLPVFVKEISVHANERDLAFLGEHMVENRRNRYIYKELEKLQEAGLDFQVLVQEARPDFPKARSLLALQYLDRNEYFTVEYEWRQGQWFISNLKERR